MIDLRDLRERPEAYQKACDVKRIKFDVSAFLKFDAEVKELRGVVEGHRASQNVFSKELPKFTGEEKTKKLAEMKEIASTLKAEEEKLRLLEERWTNEQLMLPSIPLSKVPIGKDDSENVESRKWGEPRKSTFKAKDHVELGKSLDILDFERGAKIAGARNYFLKGDGTRLQHAVLQYAMDLLHARGYILMDVPHLVKYSAMMGTSYFPGGEEQAYHLDERDNDGYLIGTSEVSVTSYHQGEILNFEELPKRYAGYSPCYRREAGSFGKDTAGLYRVHQFYKIEQVVVCEATEAESAEYHAELLGNAEAVMQGLNLPYRVVEVCTGDMGRGQVYKNDIEAWMPSRNNWGETHSCSTFYDFQARRLNMRYKGKDSKNQYCHTLNNTCVATPRVLIPILENNQNEDGSVTVPEVLRKYLGQDRIVAKR